MASTEVNDRLGEWAMYALVIVLALIYLGTTFGPPPRDATTSQSASALLAAVVALGWWIDSHQGVPSKPG